MNGERPSVATVDLAAVAHNYSELRRRAGERALIAVVKADAYGHGATTVARALEEAGCPRLAVVTVAEAAALREEGARAPILVLGGVHDAAEAEACLAACTTPVIQHEGQVELLAKAAAPAPERVPVELEVDTGMGRMGVPPDRTGALLRALAETPGLVLQGLYTHLARADEPDLGPVREQLRRFGELLRSLRAAGHDPGVVHVQNSAGLLAEAALADVLPATGAVRPGLGLYGVRPAPHLEADLRPVMTLTSRVVNLRRVGQGEGVGYGHSWRAPRDTTIATLPLGYADGVPWTSGNRARVRLADRLLPVVGRISMDYVTVDVGDAPVALGDRAIVFGPGLPVEEVAAAAGTISYEVLVRVGARVPRVTRA